MARNVSCPVCLYEGSVWEHNCTEQIPSVLASSNPLRLLQEEIAQLRVDLARVTEERDSARRELQKTQLAWALWLLEDVLAGCLAVADAEFDGVPAPVAALIRPHAGMPIGECTRCGRTAPLAGIINVAPGRERQLGVCAPTWPGCGALEPEPAPAAGGESASHPRRPA